MGDSTNGSRNVDGTFKNLHEINADRFEQLSAGVNPNDSQFSANAKLQAQRLAAGKNTLRGMAGSREVTPFDQALWQIIKLAIFYPILLGAAVLLTFIVVKSIDESREQGRNPNGFAKLAAWQVLDGRTLQPATTYLTAAQASSVMSPKQLESAVLKARDQMFTFGLPRTDRTRVSAYICATDPVCRSDMEKLRPASLDDMDFVALQFLSLQAGQGVSTETALRDYCIYPLAVEPKTKNVGNARSSCQSMVNFMKPEFQSSGREILNRMSYSLPFMLDQLLAVGSRPYQ